MASRRDELLDVLVDHIQHSGVENASFRTLAVAAGVRHNTLTHHFGSRSELLAAVFERLAQRIVGPTGPFSAESGLHGDRLRAVRHQLTSSPFASLWPVFFEVLGVALRTPEQHQAFLRHVSTDWTGLLTEQLVAQGRSPRQARAAATVVVAAVRGLVLDVCSGGNQDRIDDAWELLAALADAAADLGTTGSA